MEARFIAAGLPKSKAEATAKNGKLGPVLAGIVDRNGITDPGTNPKQANLLLQLATSSLSTPLESSAQDMLAVRVSNGGIQTQDQLMAGIAYLKDNDSPTADELDKASGVGVTVTPEQVASSVASYVHENLESLRATTWSSLSTSMAALKLTDSLRWASPLEVKKSLESSFTQAFGTKEEYDKVNAANKAIGKQKPAKTATAAATAEGEGPVASTSTDNDSISATNMFEEGFLARLHPVGGNPQLSEKLREEHMKATQGKVFTRFPPEPNGYLHIGHSKAIAINFGFAQYHKGHCYLRFDDTNPETEEQVYIDSCLDVVRWLGFEPWKVTYSSDHFQALYDLAVELIRRDKAYMCYCSKDTIFENRGGEARGPRKACEHRSRPVEASLAEFEKMKNGGFAPEDNATLRMKQDLDDPSPQMWDLVAYRTPKGSKHHHRTGDQWTIYPTYDFTHCLCDSFENITHSLCTTEFVMSRQSYEWLCDAVSVYKPRQSEYGRLKLQGTFLSKRKIMKLVNKGIVDGWDDPRLYTLIALRRRGIPPGAILSFVNNIGVTTADTGLSTHRFEQTIRSYLETTVPRLMVVLKPLKVTLTNVPADFAETVDKPLHTKDASMGTNRVYLTQTVYIEETDFRSVDSKDFFRLAPGKTVGLLYAAYPITCTSFKTDEKTGEVAEVLATYGGFTEDGEKVTTPSKKVKTYIHWVAQSAQHNSPVKVEEVRIFSQLFKSDDPSTLEGDEAILADIDPSSLQVRRGAYIETGIYDIIDRLNKQATIEKQEHTEDVITSDPAATLRGGTTGGNERIRFQALRTAYFCIDKDADIAALRTGSGGRSPTDTIILNQIVSLKEDKSK